MKTRERIITASISLFNQFGTKNITTNHIAESLNISVGNLYYHFKNKEQIIRAILEEIIEATNDVLSHTEEEISSFAFVSNIFAQVLKMQYHYRFFHNEIATLLKNDPTLQKRYQELQAIRFAELEVLIQQLITQKILKKKELKGYLSLLEAVWIIWTFWITNLEIEGKALNEREIKRGVFLIFELFVPQLTEKGLKNYKEIKKKWEAESLPSFS